MIDFTYRPEPTLVRVADVEDHQTAFSLRRRLLMREAGMVQLVPHTWVELCIDSEMCPGGFRAWVEYPTFGLSLLRDCVGEVVVSTTRAMVTDETELWLAAIDIALADGNMILDRDQL